MNKQKKQTNQKKQTHSHRLHCGGYQKWRGWKEDEDSREGQIHGDRRPDWVVSTQWSIQVWCYKAVHLKFICY